MNKTKLVSQTDEIKENKYFGIFDPRGREIGAQIRTFDATFEPIPEGDAWYYHMEPGHYYALKVWATRDGKPFGAMQSTRFFKTIEERQGAIDKYLKYAQKRAGMTRRGM